MDKHIYVKRKAINEKKCKDIIDVLNVAKLKPANSDAAKNFYSGTHANVYEQDWAEDLFKCMIEYKEQHKFLDLIHHGAWKVQLNCNYQKYTPNQNYSAEHCEQGPREAESRRMIVWSIYCNTITNGGETYFPQQDIFIKPEEGTVAIWPAAWTHSHYGKPAPKEYKYIVTGWASYVKM